MPRLKKPNWNVPGKGRKGKWRTFIDGRAVYCPDDIPRDERPQLAGIPVRAWEWLRKIEAEHAASLRGLGGVLTVRVLCESYTAWAEREAAEGRLSIGQAKGIRSRLKLFAAFADVSGKAEDFTVDRLHDFFDRIRGQASGHYLAGVGRSIRAAFRWGAKRVPGRDPVRLLAENPIAGYDFPRAPRSVRGYVEGVIVRRFLRWAWARARAQPGLYRRFDRLFVLMLRFQRLTGCRPGEACDLRWDDIRWDEGRIVIPKERQKTGHITGKERIIYLTFPVVRLLRIIERLEDHHPTHVFPHRRGKGATGRGHVNPLGGEPWPSGSAASAKVRTLRNEAVSAGLEGIETVGPKKLVAYVNRHAYASDVIAMGKTHEQAAALLGNTAAVVAQTYAHSVQEVESLLAQEIARGRKQGKAT